MTYTSLATPVPNTKILVSTFGALVKQDLDDLDARVTTNAANLGSPWSGGSALSRIQYLETSHSIRYETTAGTTLTNNADTDIPFGTVVRADTTVFTVSGANFTCVKAGWVDAATSIRGNGVANMELKIKLNGTLVASDAGGPSVTSAVSTGFPVAVGDIIKVSVFHSSGANKTLETGAGRMNHLALSWRGL